MRIFGFELRSPFHKAARDLHGVNSERGWTAVFEAHPETDFQQDVHRDTTSAQRNWAVFACQTLIAGDMGKMRVRLGRYAAEKGGVFIEIVSAAFSPVLRKPNPYQTWPQFIRSWMFSKLRRGNTYVLKVRDARNVVVELHVLDPDRCEPLIDPDTGDVFYRLHQDDLAQIGDSDVAVPASELIHDRMWCLFHPLVGLPPLFASALAAQQGIDIQTMSRTFFKNGARPSGLLTTPNAVDPTTLDDMKKRWEANYAGGNRGRTAILANGLEYKVITDNAVDSELVAQLKLSATMVCSTYHVPAYKVGIGETPTVGNAETLNQIYYDDGLGVQIKDIETCLEEGLGIEAAGYAVEFNLEDLLRMDSASQISSLNEAVKGGWMKPNEARAKRGLLPVKGGDSPMMQQQQFSLEALAERDKEKPFAKPPKPAPAPPAANDETAEEAAEKAVTEFLGEIRKGLEACAT